MLKVAYHPISCLLHLYTYIGAELIMQVSLVLPQRILHDGQNHLLCNVKISGFKNWFIEVWMSAETGRVTIIFFL